MITQDSHYKKLSKERKQLQADGKLPEWFTTSGWQLFKEKYLWASDYREQVKAISAALAKHTDKPVYWEQKFYDAIWSGNLSPSTPIYSNCGTDRGLVVSCAGQYVEDSIDGFFTARREAAILTKHGFGTSGYLGDIRHRGSAISTGGVAAGVMPVIKGFMQDSRDVSQGGVRRGAFASYLPIDHADFNEVVSYLEKEPDDFNLGWVITDEWMKNLEKGEGDARQRFSRALKVKMVTGKGYFWFVDKANKRLPQKYKDAGMKNHASNLCLTGDTILTVRIGGHVKKMTLKEVVESNSKLIEVLSFDIESSEAQFKKITNKALTAKDAKLMKITDSKTGKFIRCTPDHKVFTKNRGYVEAKNLLATDELAIM